MTTRSNASAPDEDDNDAERSNGSSDDTDTDESALDEEPFPCDLLYQESWTFENVWRIMMPLELEKAVDAIVTEQPVLEYVYYLEGIEGENVDLGAVEPAVVEAMPQEDAAASNEGEQLQLFYPRVTVEPPAGWEKHLPPTLQAIWRVTSKLYVFDDATRQGDTENSSAATAKEDDSNDAAVANPADDKEKPDGEERGERSLSQKECGAETVRYIKDAFATLSPFALIHPTVPAPIRELFGVLAGITDWFPRKTDLPLAFWCLTAVFAQRKSTPPEIIEILCSALPDSVGPAAAEMLRIATGHANDTDLSFIALAELTGAPIDDLLVARSLLSPEQGSYLLPKKLWPSGTPELKSTAVDKATHKSLFDEAEEDPMVIKRFLKENPSTINWINVISDIAQGDLFSLVRCPLLDFPGLLELGRKTQMAQSMRAWGKEELAEEALGRLEGGTKSGETQARVWELFVTKVLELPYINQIEGHREVLEKALHLISGGLFILRHEREKAVTALMKFDFQGPLKSIRRPAIELAVLTATMVLHDTFDDDPKGHTIEALKIIHRVLPSLANSPKFCPKWWLANTLNVATGVLDYVIPILEGRSVELGDPDEAAALISGILVMLRTDNQCMKFGPGKTFFAVLLKSVDSVLNRGLEFPQALAQISDVLGAATTLYKSCGDWRRQQLKSLKSILANNKTVRDAKKKKKAASKQKKQPVAKKKPAKKADGAKKVKKEGKPKNDKKATGKKAAEKKGSGKKESKKTNGGKKKPAKKKKNKKKILPLNITLSVADIEAQVEDIEASAGAIVEKVNLVSQIAEQIADAASDEQFDGVKFFLTMIQILSPDGGDGEALVVMNLLGRLAKKDFTVITDILRRAGVNPDDSNLSAFLQAITLLSSFDGKKGGASALSSIDTKDVLEVVGSLIFQQCDVHKRGKLSFEDFNTSLKRMRLSVSQYEARAWFQELDTDDNGYVGFDEFQIAMKSVGEMYLTKILEQLHLTREAIYAALVVLALFAICLLAFIILAAVAFSDGSNFTAVISALFPMLGVLASGAPDASQINGLISKVDEVVEEFFEAVVDGG